MKLLLPNRWQKQPQGQALEIDWNHPLAKGLTGFWVLNTSLPINLVDGVKSSYSTKPTQGTRDKGKTVTSSFRTNKTLAQLFNTTSAIGTMATGYYSTVSSITASQANVFGRRVNISSAEGCGVYRTGIFDFGGRLTATVAETVGSHFLALTSGHDGLLRGIKDGAILGSQAKASSIPNTSEVVHHSLYDATTGVSTDIATYYMATWNRSLSPNELQKFRQNPYQILKPRKRLFAVGSLDIEFDLDLPLPTLDFNAEIIQVEENQLFADINLDLPALDFEADFLNGVTGDFLLPLPSTDLFINMGVFNVLNPALTLPRLDFNAEIITGTLIDAIDLVIPAPDIGGVLLNGTVISLDLDLPVPAFEATFAESLDLTLPAPVFEATILNGNVMALNLPLSIPNISFEIQTERAFDLALTMPAPKIEMNIVTDNVINFDLPLPIPMIQANMLSGLVMALDLPIPAPEVELNFASGRFMAIDLPIPAPQLEMALFQKGAPASTGFFNRWTR